MREREHEWAEGQRQKQTPLTREPSMGLDPEIPGL